MGQTQGLIKEGQIFLEKSQIALAEMRNLVIAVRVTMDTRALMGAGEEIIRKLEDRTTYI